LGPKNDRARQIVDDVQHRDRDDEGEVEPVGHVDVGFLALHQGAEEDQRGRRPTRWSATGRHTIPARHIPCLGDAEQIAGGRQHDEELVAPEDEPGEIAQRQSWARQVRWTT
jgi:hypothetical protein